MNTKNFILTFLCFLATSFYASAQFAGVPTLPVLLPKWKSSKLKIETSVRWFIWPIQHQTPTIGTTLRVG